MRAKYEIRKYLDDQHLEKLISEYLNLPLSETGCHMVVIENYIVDPSETNCISVFEVPSVIHELQLKAHHVWGS